MIVRPQDSAVNDLAVRIARLIDDRCIGLDTHTHNEKISIFFFFCFLFDRKHFCRGRAFARRIYIQKLKTIYTIIT